MSRRTSFFNLAVFRTDIKRFWWIPAAHTLGIILFCLFPMHQELTFLLEERGIIGSSYVDAEFIHSLWGNQSVASYLMLFIVPVVLSMLLFSYLNKKSAVATAHAQPVTRLSLYITHTLFGFAALAVPVLINAVILLFMRTDSAVAQVLTLPHIRTWVCTVLVYSAIAFSLTTFVGMLTGNIIAQPIFTYILAALPVFVEAMIKAIAQLHLYGYSGSTELLTQNIYFDLEKIAKPSGALIYLGLALAFLIAGYFIYKLRHLENHGEIIAFPVLKPVFVYGVALCAGFLGFAYLNAIAQLENLLLLIPFGILGLIIANMISKKAFTLRGACKPGVAFVVTVFAIFGIFQFDTLGFADRMPDIEDIESAVVTQRTYVNSYGTIDGRRVVEKEYVPALTAPEDIENALKFHQYKIETPMAREDIYAYADIYINYHLKNGKTFTRKYPVDFAEDKEFLKPLMETTENKTERFPILEEPGHEIISMRIEDDRLSGAFGAYLSEAAEDQAVINRLKEALRADLIAVPYEEFIDRAAMPTRIRVNRKVELVYEGTDTPIPDSEMHITEMEETYYVRASYANTIAILRELGFYDALPTAESYNAVKVERLIPDREDYRHATLTEAADEDTITDPAVIAELYHYVTTTRSEALSDNNTVIISFTFTSQTYQDFTVTRSANDRNIPESLKYLFA